FERDEDLRPRGPRHRDHRHGDGPLARPRLLQLHRAVRPAARSRRLLHQQPAGERGRRAVPDGGVHRGRAQLSRDALSGDQSEPALSRRRAAGGLMGEALAAPVPVAPRLEVPLLEARGLHKSYWLGEKEIHVLRGASFALGPGEMASLVGPSGVGKSTFLHVVGTLDPPTAGQVLYDGQDAFAMGEEPLARFRNRNIGFVFQFHYLLPEFTALENTAMPALIGRMPRPEAEGVARQMLDLVGLSHRVEHKPGELSGGEQQRVALARALVLKPRLLLADEPTGNLDEATGEGIHQLLTELNQRLGIAAIVVTHNPRLAERMPRRLRLREGWVVEA